mmetsp:Transcript_3108/g.7137  ORF Transcript_3108/g.7137 Transcript_3108/m.7137 type:complete len:210 (-) Transcript_3108:710-1339(-)
MKRAACIHFHSVKDNLLHRIRSSSHNNSSTLLGSCDSDIPQNDFAIGPIRLTLALCSRKKWPAKATRICATNIYTISLLSWAYPYRVLLGLVQYDVFEKHIFNQRCIPGFAIELEVDALVASWKITVSERDISNMAPVTNRANRQAQPCAINPFEQHILANLCLLVREKMIVMYNWSVLHCNDVILRPYVAIMYMNIAPTDIKSICVEC